jgi:DNA-binding response OmpR family regulator
MVSSEVARRMHADIKPRPTILVVEKDREVLDLIAEVIRRAGYEVLAVSDPGVVVLLCADAKQSIDLVVCEFNLPGLNGIQLAKNLRTIDPSVEFIIMSGHPAALEAATSEGLAGVRKPFSFSELLTAIHERIGTGR